MIQSVITYVTNFYHSSPYVFSIIVAFLIWYTFQYFTDQPKKDTITDSSSSSSKSITPISNVSSSSNIASSSTSTSSVTKKVPSSSFNDYKCTELFEWDPDTDYLSSGSSCKVYVCRLRSEYKPYFPDVPTNLVVKEYIISDIRKNIQQNKGNLATLKLLMKQAEREYTALCLVRHPQVVCLVHMFKEYNNTTQENPRISSSSQMSKTDSFPDAVYVVMEKAPTVPAGELLKTMTVSQLKFLSLFAGPTDLHYYFSTRNRMSEQQVALIMYQILLAVRQLHNINLVHRDLKPANILIFGEKSTKYGIIPICKLGDFGLARDATTINAQGQNIDTEKTFGTGTPLYIAPEAFHKVSTGSAVYGTEFDIFSLGTILFNLLTKEFPYDLNIFMSDMLNMIEKVQIQWNIAEKLQLSTSSIQLMKAMTNSNGKLRPNIDTILKDAWFDKVRSDAIEMFGTF